MSEQMRKIAAAAAILSACGMLSAAFLPAHARFGREEKSAVEAFAKSEEPGQILCFRQEDFTDRLIGEEELTGIVISGLPEQGTLRLAGETVRQGEAVPAERLSALCFVPDIGSEVHTRFTFVPVFHRSGAGGEPVAVSLNVTDTPGSAPIAVQQSFETYADLPLYGRLKAVDPDGDACTFTVTRQGKRGTAEITEAGFCYHPSGKAGEDSFCVAAEDIYGNRSAPAEITVRVIRRADRETFTYTDMNSSPAHFAALRLREEGVFSGECFGEEAFFCPDQPVTRAEFLAMASAAAKLSQPEEALHTGLSDQEEIPVWARSYVAAGLLTGLVNGSDDGSGNRAFRAEAPITRAEAASILNRSLSLTDDGRRPAFSDGKGIPAWAEQAVVNTAAAGILPVFGDNTVRCGDPVTREDAAVMLYEMMLYSQDKK